MSMETALSVERPASGVGILGRVADPICKRAHDFLCRPFTIPTPYRPQAYGLHERSGTFDPGRQLRLRWLGTAGYEISAAGTTVLIDPFASRPGLLKLLSGRKIGADALAGARYFPKADYILTGHSHYDHLMDVPHIALRTGAVVAGSKSTCTVARACGVPEERLREVGTEGARFTMGPFEVRFVPSRHGRFWFGDVPNDGEIRACPHDGKMRSSQYKMGGAFGLWLRVGDLTLYHNGSADLCDDEIEGMRADVLLMCLAGRGATREYVPRLTGLLHPRWIVPTHYDGFFRPLAEGLRILPRIDLNGFFSESRECAKKSAILMPEYEEGVVFSLNRAAV